jgi:putative Mg2+ transporter-C (MgtC) family protein
MEEIGMSVLKMVLAMGLGFLIGAEREKNGKPAGTRTLALVCVASTFITIISMDYGFADTTRVLQGIITGIGFLGAGAIIANGTNVIGLTTAATIWAVSILGVGIGAGEYIISIIFALIVYFVLLERRIENMEKKLVSRFTKKNIKTPEIK